MYIVCNCPSVQHKINPRINTGQQSIIPVSLSASASFAVVCVAMVGTEYVWDHASYAATLHNLHRKPEIVFVSAETIIIVPLGRSITHRHSLQGIVALVYLKST